MYVNNMNNIYIYIIHIIDMHFIIMFQKIIWNCMSTFILFFF